MTSKLTREENVQAVFDLKAGYTLGLADVEILKRVARMALAAMDSEPVEMPLDYLQGHKDGLEFASQLAEANHPETGDWLYDDPIELAKAIRKGPDMPPVQPVEDSDPDRNPVLAYADSYRDMAKQGVESVPIWSVITDLERNIAPLYRHAQQPAVPEGLRLALSNAGIAAPESDEMLAATQGKYIQQLVSWVRDRKPFQPAPVLKPVGYLFVSDQGVVAYSPTNWGMPDFRLIGQIYGDMNVELQPAQKRAHKWSYGLVHPENCQCIECRSARINGVKP